MKTIKRKLFFWFIEQLPPCDVISRQLSDANDLKLTFSEWVKLKLHLKCCVWCTRYGQQIDFLDKAMQRHFMNAEKQIIEASLSSESKNRMKQLIENYQN